MTVAVAQPRRPGIPEKVEIFFPGRGDRPLEAEVELGLGVSVFSDVTPIALHRIVVQEWSPAALILLSSLIGERSVRDVERRLHALRSSPAWHAPPRGGSDLGVHLEIGGIDRNDIGAWGRVISVELLNRWLNVPVPQEWFDAERAFARCRAARPLPRGPARDCVLGDALALARSASAALVSTLNRRAGEEPLSLPFVRAVTALRDGFLALVEAVSVPDERLTDVIQAATAALDRALATHPADPPRPSPASGPLLTGRRCPIDPRQVPARLLLLSADPRVGEVRLTPAADGYVEVEVPAQLGRSGYLLVRMLDQSSGELLSEQKLQPTLDADGTVVSFRATCRVADRTLDQVRADVFDAMFFQPVVNNDADTGMFTVRSAVARLVTQRLAAARTGSDATDDALHPIMAELLFSG